MSDLPPHALRKLLDAAAPLGEDASATLGRYRLVREVGRGGMGVVYEAWDPELRRRVALKTLPAGEAGGLRARLAREALAAARLNHPNIAAVYEATPEFIVMQFVDGPPLSQLPRGDLRRAVTLVRDAARAVHHAHEQGIIHRDLKPQNVLVEGDRAVVTDFGLAKELSAESSLSLPGGVVGSPAWMPPEQALGRAGEVDARSDVYGLGATLYDVLAGRPPFVEREVLGLLRRIVEERPPRLRAFRPDVPRDLETVVLKCLEKDRARRYQTARELAGDLDRWLEGRPVVARPASVGYRLLKFAQRRRAVVAVAAAGLALMMIAGVVAWNERVHRRASSDALRLSERIDGAVRDAEQHFRLGMVEAAHRRLDDAVASCRAFLAGNRVAHAQFLLGRLLRLRDRDEEAAQALEAALELDPTIEEARIERGMLRARRLALQAGELAPPVAADDAARLPPGLRALREQALEDLRAIESPGLVLDRVSLGLARAERHRLSGRPVEARRELEEVIRFDRTNRAARVVLSQLALASGDGDLAWHLAMSAVDLHRGFGPAYLAQSAAHGALAREGATDPVDQVAARHEMTAADRKIAGGDRSAAAFLERASARLRIDDVEGALADFGEALKVDPTDAPAYGNRALLEARRAAALAAEGSAGEALEAWDRAIADATSALTVDPDLAGAWNNRGVSRCEKARLLEEARRPAEAEREWAAALGDFEAAVTRAPRFALARLNRAMERRRRGEGAAAAGRLREAEAEAAAARGDVDEALRLRPDDAGAWLERALLSDLDANVRASLGDHALAARFEAEAGHAFDRAVALAQDEARPRGLRALHRLRRGDTAGGRADLEAALRLAPDARLRRRLEAERAAGRR
jgi:serine/threonine-protein kinase